MPSSSNTPQIPGVVHRALEGDEVDMAELWLPISKMWTSHYPNMVRLAATILEKVSIGDEYRSDLRGMVQLSSGWSDPDAFLAQYNHDREEFERPTTSEIIKETVEDLAAEAELVGLATDGSSAFDELLKSPLLGELIEEIFIEDGLTPKQIEAMASAHADFAQRITRVLDARFPRTPPAAGR